MLTPLQKPHKRYLYFSSKIVYMDLVVAEIYNDLLVLELKVLLFVFGFVSCSFFIWLQFFQLHVSASPFNFFDCLFTGQFDHLHRTALMFFKTNLLYLKGKYSSFGL